MKNPHQDPQKEKDMFDQLGDATGKLDETLGDISQWVDNRYADLESWWRISHRNVADAEGLRGSIMAVFRRMTVMWKYWFAGKPVLFLGPKGGGKTSLMVYLMKGRPEDWGATVALTEMDRVGEIREEQVLHFLEDIGGDPSLRDFWPGMLARVNPEAIVFVLNGAKDMATIQQDLRETLEAALPVYLTGRGKLRVVYTLLNFYDEWQHDMEKRHRLRPEVDRIVQEEKMKYPTLLDVKFEIYHSQLNPAAPDWEEARLAMEHLATDLKSYKVRAY
jgi:hypothetical protein